MNDSGLPSSKFSCSSVTAKWRFTPWIIVLFVGALMPLNAATVGISNLGQPTLTSVGVGKLSGFDFQEAGSFTTGGTAYDLASVSLDIASRSGAGVGFSVSLYTGISTSGPTGLVATLLGNSAPTPGFYDYVPAIGTTLSPFSTYWIVESAISTPLNTGFGIRSTSSTSEDAGGLAGWTIGDTRWLTNNGGTSWFQAASTSLEKFSVNVVTLSVPDGGMTAALLCAAIVCLGTLRRKFSGA